MATAWVTGTGVGDSMLISSISMGGVIFGGLMGLACICATPSPAAPCNTAATDHANTLVLLELSTEITTINQSAQAERVTGKLYKI